MNSSFGFIFLILYLLIKIVIIQLRKSIHPRTRREPRGRHGRPGQRFCDKAMAQLGHPVLPTSSMFDSI